MCITCAAVVSHSLGLRRCFNCRSPLQLVSSARHGTAGMAATARGEIGLNRPQAGY